MTPNLPVTSALDSEGRRLSKISPSTCQGRWAAPSSEIKAGTQNTTLIASARRQGAVQGPRPACLLP